MSALTQLSFLALAGSVLAVPYHGHGHAQHRHAPSGYSYGTAGTAAFLPAHNATGVYAPTGSVVTVTPVPSGTGFSSVDAEVDAASTSDCTSDSTVTTKVQTTVYVTARDEFVNHQHSFSQKSSTSTSSSYVASTTTTSAYVASTTSSSSSSATSSSTATSSSSSAGFSARGIAYNDVDLTTAFLADDKMGWAYNWGSATSDLSSTLVYIPLLWGTDSGFTDVWSANAQAAIDSGSTHLMSFNEPDLSSQADLTPAEAATAYKTYMEPFAGKAKLGAPAVTNGGGSMGLTWLSEFITACDDCTIDFVSIHWYAGYDATSDFESHVTNATDISGGLPVFVSEFGCNDGTDDEISSFLETVLPWMEDQSFVHGYAYFMAEDGLLNTGTALSSIGSTYAST